MYFRLFYVPQTLMVDLFAMAHMLVATYYFIIRLKLVYSGLIQSIR